MAHPVHSHPAMTAIDHPAVASLLRYLDAVGEDAVSDGVPSEAVNDALGETSLLLAAALANLADDAAWELLAIQVEGYAGDDGASRVDSLRASL